MINPNPPPGAKLRCDNCGGKGWFTTGLLWWKREHHCRQCHGKGYGFATYTTDPYWPHRSKLVIDYKSVTYERFNSVWYAPPPPP